MGWQDDPVVSDIPGANPDLAKQMIADAKAGKKFDIRVDDKGNQIPAWKMDAVVAPKAATDSGGMSAARAQLDALNEKQYGPVTTPPQEERRGFGASLADLVTGPADAALSIGKNLVGTLAGSVAGVAKSLTGGNFGTDAGVEQGAQTAESVRKAIVGAGPITKTGAKILAGVGNVVDATKIAGLNPATALNELTPGAARVATKLSAMDAAATENIAKINALEKPAMDGVRAAREVGYVITPTEMKAGLLARNAEGLSGSARNEKAMARANVETTDKIIRAEVGLAPNVPISGEALSTQLEKLSPAYERAKSLGNLALDDQYKPSALAPKIETFDNGSRWLNPAEQQFMSATDAVESIKSLRADARDLYKSYKVNPHPDTLKSAEAHLAEANALEDLLDRNAKMRGQPEILSDLRDARVKAAKIYLADKALNDETGHINASIYKRELDKGQLGNTPLTGGSLQVAKFASQFEKLAQRAERIGNTDASFGDAAMAMLKAAGAGAAGVGAHAAGASLTGGVGTVAALMARPVTRAALRTNVVQNLMMPKPKELGLGRRSLTTLADLQGQSPMTLAELSAERRQ